jgi:hypothetical protein
MLRWILGRPEVVVAEKLLHRGKADALLDR